VVDPTAVGGYGPAPSAIFNFISISITIHFYFICIISFSGLHVLGLERTLHGRCGQVPFFYHDDMDGVAKKHRCSVEIDFSEKPNPPQNRNIRPKLANRTATTKTAKLANCIFNSFAVFVVAVAKTKVSRGNRFLRGTYIFSHTHHKNEHIAM
jgi:hypothetical protein